MSKIKIISLGGLNETGKNMYSVEIDNNIFIFNAGLKYPDDSYLGIDYVIPDFKYIKENIKNIKGIFITEAQEENYGAIIDLIKELPEIKIYGTRLTIEIIKQDLEVENIKFENFIEVTPHKQIKFGKLSIFPISLTASMPDSVGYVLNTEDGAIFYTGDYLFDQSMTGKYKTDIGKIAYIGKQNVLCMLGTSIYSDKDGYTAPSHRITPLLKQIFIKSKDRIIMSVNDSDMHRIQELLDEVTLEKRTLIIMGKTLSSKIKQAIELEFIDFDINKIGNLSNLNDKGVVVLTSNERKRPYSAIDRIVNGYDKYIKLKETDMIVLGESPLLGYEKKAAATMDGIARKGAEYIHISPKKYLLPQASKEDIMLMLNLVNPKYYMPVGSEYRYQYTNSLIAKKYGMSDENIILAKNGDVIEFIDGEKKPIINSIKVEELLIDGNTADDIGELVLKDREMLSEDGIVIVTASIDKHTKKLLAGPEIITRGFIYVKNNKDLIEESKNLSKKIIEENTTVNRIDFSKVKNDIRKDLGKYLYKQTESKPMIITVINDI